MTPHELTLINFLLTVINFLLTVLAAILLRRSYFIAMKKRRLGIAYISLMTLIAPILILLVFITPIQLIILCVHSFIPSLDLLEPEWTIPISITDLAIFLTSLTGFIWFSVRPARDPATIPAGKLKEPVLLKLALAAWWLSIPAIPLIIIITIHTGAFWSFWKEYKDGVLRSIGPYLALGPVFYMLKAVYKKQKDIGELKDKKDLVLYLRSFYLDQIPFARVKVREKEFGGLPQSTQYIKSSLSFEAYFGYQLKQKLGEMVIVVKPGHPIPHLGTWMVHLPPQGWSDQVNTLIKNAKAILVRVGETQYLKQELEMIIRIGGLPKTYIFTEPRPVSKKSVSEWIRHRLLTPRKSHPASYRLQTPI